MSIRIPKGILFLISFAVLLVLYWPALHGTPIWDDFTFWFNDPTMKETTSYFDIWKNYGWPLSVSIQKFMLSLFHENYFYYHLINLLLHFTNAFLVYQLGRVLKLKYPFIYFLLFLLHPIAVITTAWMVQIKTLLCFSFGLSSLLCYIKGRNDKKRIFLSWVLFGCSVASKSSSLTLPLIILFIHFKYFRFTRTYLLIPFFLFSGWNGYRILKSPITQEGTEKAAMVTKIKDEPKVEAPVVEKAPKEVAKPEPVTVAPPKEEAPTLAMDPLPKKETALEGEDKTPLNFFDFDIHIISQTMHYYFWQTLIPLDNEPVKGLNYNRAGAIELIHILFLIIMVILFWKDSNLLYLGAAHFLLIPFLGFIPAPFMNITWVSDQHLYLVLPALLAFWMRVIEKVKWKYNYLLPCFFLIFFAYKTNKAAPYYKDQFTFYESSLAYNPLNIPIAYNLAFARLLNGEVNLAYNIVAETYQYTEDFPVMKKNVFYPYLVYLYARMDEMMEKK